MEFPDDRLYSEDGFWLKLEGDTATIGITDWLEQQLGGLAHIEYNESLDEQFLIIHSQMRRMDSHHIPKPILAFPKQIAGKPDGCNGQALEYPNEISDFYGKDSWLYKMKFEKSSATELMTAAKFRDFIERYYS